MSPSDAETIIDGLLKTCQISDMDDLRITATNEMMEDDLFVLLVRYMSGERLDRGVTNPGLRSYTRTVSGDWEGGPKNIGYLPPRDDDDDDEPAEGRQFDVEGITLF